jgi:RNA recognition motif-containing protein
MNIFVGNLSFDASEENVRKEFEAFGGVTSVNLIIDRQTGRPRGFGFVEMPNDEEAKTAIKTLDGKDLNGRPVKVNEARPKTDNRSGGGGGGGRGPSGPRRSGGGGGGRW